MGVYTVYIRYIHLIQLIQMDRCSVIPPHRDLIQLFKIFKKIFSKFFHFPLKTFFRFFAKIPLKTLDKSSAICYNVSTIRYGATKPNRKVLGLDNLHIFLREAKQQW